MDGPGEEGFHTPEKQRPSDADPESVLRKKISDVFKDTTLTPAERFARVNALRGLKVSGARSMAREKRKKKEKKKKENQLLLALLTFFLIAGDSFKADSRGGRGSCE